MVFDFFGAVGNVINSITGANKSQLDAQRESQKKAWQDAIGPTQSSDPIGKAITDNATLMQNNYQNSQEGGSSNGEGGSNGGDGSSNGGSSNGSVSAEEAQKQAEEKARQEAQKKALASIAKMKDSNVSYQYKSDYNDPWTATAREKQNDIWALNGILDTW